METDQQFQSSQCQPHKKRKQTGTKQKQGSLCKRWTFTINNYDETDINRLEQTAKDINQFTFFLAETRPFYWQHTDIVKGYDLVNDLTVVPNLWTFNFTQYQGLNAASGSHCEFTGILNAVGIPVKFPAGILWDPSEMPGFLVGFPSLSPGEIPVEFPAGIMVITCGICWDPTWDSRHFSRWNPSWFQWNPSWNFTGIPLEIPVTFSMEWSFRDSLIYSFFDMFLCRATFQACSWSPPLFRVPTSMRKMRCRAF